MTTLENSNNHIKYGCQYTTNKYTVYTGEFLTIKKLSYILFILIDSLLKIFATSGKS